MGIPSVNYTVSGQDFDIPVDETEQTDPTEFLIKALRALENHDHAPGRGHYITSNIGIGIAPQANSALAINGSILTGATSQIGVASVAVGDSGATGAIVGIEGTAQTAATAFTCGQAIALHAKPAVKGAGSTITSTYGLLIDAQVGGGTNNYGIVITAPSGGATDNFGLVNLGTTKLLNMLYIAGSAAGGLASTIGFTNTTAATGGGAAPTFGTIGGSGPTAAAQAGWYKWFNGTQVCFFPYWV